MPESGVVQLSKSKNVGGIASEVTVLRSGLTRQRIGASSDAGGLMKQVIGWAAALCAFLAAAPAQAAFCMEPKAPSMLFVTKPNKPWCARDRSCDQWEVNSYKSQLERYFSQLEEYLADVDRYRKKAVEYANCMAQLD